MIFHHKNIFFGSYGFRFQTEYMTVPGHFFTQNHERRLEFYENDTTQRTHRKERGVQYQYLGVPYVWGGDSPSGFDCSGYVSYCINNCGAGWNVGRCDCNGLLRICTTVSASEAQPGDLVFFQGTYNTSGASHVGIYLGDGKMIHAGSPVQVTDMTTSYYQQHFYTFGRLLGM